MNLPVANFHGLGQPPAWIPDEEVPLWLSLDQFRHALDLLCASGADFMVTFDDGNETDFAVGMPACVERGIRATCFACTGRIGKSGYLSAEQLRAMASWARCEIGSHGHGHLPLRNMSDADLLREIRDSRLILERVIQMRVKSFAAPFGAYNRHVLAAAHKAGYERVYSSDGASRLFALGAIPRLSFRGDRDIAEQVAQLLRNRSAMVAILREARLIIKALR